ncbi:SDR family oxidoreductase [Sorangium sp. So ce426]|uniref:SDR family oxidoreductase n=1 Tax=unclassified Sorangium TaxID=2621164 RepID=UPI003F5C02A2
MERALDGKAALVTGASRGIGRAIALRLAAMGARVVVNYLRDVDAAQRTADDLARLGVACTVVQADVGDPAAVRRLVDASLAAFGCIDVLVHNAAAGVFIPLHRLRLDDWELSLNVNARAFMLLAQGLAPAMERRGGGTIVAISSLGAQRVVPAYGAIGISKAALEAQVRYLAAELAPKGIRVNGVSGGLVESDVLRMSPSLGRIKDEMVRRTPAGRLGTPEDLARVVGFLASPDAGWIHGQTLVVDGGSSLV